GHSDARVDEQLLAALEERALEGREETLGDLEGAAARARLDQHRELIATHPGNRVADADRVPEPIGHGDEDLVALTVTEAVVDRLEVVEVEEEDGESLSRATHPGQRVLQPIGEEGPVREAGEGVMEGLVAELVLERAPLRDVA